MIRWIRNVFLGAAIAIAICWVFALAIMSEVALEVLVLGAILLVLGTILFILLWALGLTRFSRQRVHERALIIMTYVEQAVRLNLPLTQMLIAAEASEPRWIGNRIGKLRRQLDGGSSIADALLKIVPGTSRRCVALIGAAERVGRVGSELGNLVRHERTQSGRDIAERTFLRAYPVAMACVIVGILSMVMVFVIPKFMQIFADFRTPLPPLTVAVINLTNLLDPGGWFIVAIGVTAITIVVQQFRHRLGWITPTFWFTTNRDLADICHVIGESLDAGMPLDSAIRNSTELSITGSMRRKLQNWADGIQRGMNSVDAAHAAGLPRLVAGLTVTAEGFEFLSRYYAAKFSRFVVLLRGAAIPAMVFFFGIIVAIVALTLFLPLVGLIDSTAGHVNAL